MKYLDEYRDADTVKKYLEDIHRLVSKPWSIMEICGGQTHSFVRNGIIDLLPDKLTMVHGPGCPVCVTPVERIDKAVMISKIDDSVLCSFGDMLRVPGTAGSLIKAKAEGADVRVVYSPSDAVRIAQKEKSKRVVFFGVGFETTAPANALSVLQAMQLKLPNYFLLSSQVLVPPAIQVLKEDKETKIDGFLAAGHVCAVTGIGPYIPLSKKYHMPIVVTGFEPVDLLNGLLSCVKQLESGEATTENRYSRIVLTDGNRHALSLTDRVFEVADQTWRGIGVLPKSGLKIKKEFGMFDAENEFDLRVNHAERESLCIAGQILKGIKKPFECAQFGQQCTPANPLGAPMVSSEGACAAYFNYK